MKDINITRSEINTIDEKMAKLFEDRMKASKEIAEYKKEHALPIFDSSREEELIKRNKEFIKDEVIREYYGDFLKQTMTISKSYQSRLNEGMKVGYAGTTGAYANIASTKMFPSAKDIAYQDFEVAYKACEKGLIDAVVLPIENSYAGDVGKVMDLIFSGNLYINQILDLNIDHSLLACKGASLKTIKTVYSHEQALRQCSDFINKNNLKTVTYANTALAAKMVAESNDPSIAAIASYDASNMFNLDIIQSVINTSRNNTTRFAAFSRVLSDNKNKKGSHSIIVFTVKNEAGALAKVLNIIGVHGYNMRNLRSRPMKELIWNYYFYVELEGNINTMDGQDLIRELSTICDKLKLVGTYSA